MQAKMTQIINIIGQFIKKDWYLIVLIIMAVCLRAAYPLTGNFVLVFDQGKDLLNSLEMLVTKEPKLIGPWTSIPGFYFGPAWYYFTAVCLALGRLSPAAPVWGMILLSICQIVLVYRYFGKVAATTVTAGTLWQTITISAWNPFPLTLVSWGIMVVLLQTSRDKRLTAKRAFLLGLLAAFGWHFSSAYAVFYPIIILLCILYQRLIINIRVILFAALGFLIPFLPQAAFELRHQFPETKALIAYVSGQVEHPADKTGWDKIDNLLKVTWGEWEINAFPNVVYPADLVNKPLARIFVVFWLIVAGITLYKVYRKKLELPELFVESLIFIFVPLLAFFKLHFNVWYLLGMAPALAWLVAGILEKQHGWIKVCWMAAVLIGGVTIWAREFAWAPQADKDSTAALWQQAWERVQEIAGERTYRLYTYRPDIYDYNMQYLVLAESLRDRSKLLPVEFSYQPREAAHVPMKAEIIERAGLRVQEGSGEAVLFVLDHPDPDGGYWADWRAHNPDFERAVYLETVGTNIQIWEASGGGVASTGGD